jgi:hypothetical protein
MPKAIEQAKTEEELINEWVYLSKLVARTRIKKVYDESLAKLEEIESSFDTEEKLKSFRKKGYEKLEETR